jgi:hypothetical protein
VKQFDMLLLKSVSLKNGLHSKIKGVSGEQVTPCSAERARQETTPGDLRNSIFPKARNFFCESLDLSTATFILLTKTFVLGGIDRVESINLVSKTFVLGGIDRVESINLGH